MKKTALLVVFAVLFSFSYVHSEDSKATPEDVYNLVLKAYEVVKALGEESFPAFNDPKGEFVYKDTYILIQRCPSQMVAHPYALDKLKDIDLDKAVPFNRSLCEAAENPAGLGQNTTGPNRAKPNRREKSAIACGSMEHRTPFLPASTAIQPKSRS